MTKPTHEEQLQQLELEKAKEELHQLRTSGKRSWMTPAAIISLVPIVAGFGLWVAGEVKQYGEGYRAIAKLEGMEKEQRALRERKQELEADVQTLLSLKRHYSEEAEALRNKRAAQQQLIDRTYLRGVFLRTEALYSLDHVRGYDGLDLTSLDQDVAALDPSIRAKIHGVLDRYKFSQNVITTTRSIITAFDESAELLEASDWTKSMQPVPSGSAIPGRSVMVDGSGGTERYYDVNEGRFLTPEEIAKERP